jgi:hypothetical protein
VTSAPYAGRITAVRRWAARTRAGAAALLVAVGGCAAAPAAGPATPAFPPLPDPVTACTSQLVHWAGEELRDADRGYDYQEMGLDSQQNDALAAIVAAARKQGPSVVDGMARDACARLAAQPPSSPWGY